MDQAGHKRAAATIACRWYAQGNCLRGDKCWFKHEVGASGSASTSRAKEKQPAESEAAPSCGICLEKPDTYALLSACSHVFCLTCVKSWRAQRGELQGSEVVKQCPVCRQKSFYFVPSPRFAEKGPDKDRIIAAYKARMAAVPCRNFQRSLETGNGTPWCRFGDECFYGHSLTPGGERVKVSRTDPNPRPPRRNTARRFVNPFAGLDYDDDDDFGAILGGGGAAGGSGGGYRAYRQANGLSTVIYDGEVYEDQLPDSDDEYIPGMGGFGAGGPAGGARGPGRAGGEADLDELVLARLMALLGGI